MIYFYSNILTEKTRFFEGLILFLDSFKSEKLLLVLRSGPVVSNLRVEPKSGALHDEELRLRISNIELNMLTAGKLQQGADTGGEESQQERGDHDW